MGNVQGFRFFSQLPGRAPNLFPAVYRAPNGLEEFRGLATRNPWSGTLSIESAHVTHVHFYLRILTTAFPAVLFPRCGRRALSSRKYLSRAFFYNIFRLRSVLITFLSPGLYIVGLTLEEMPAEYFSKVWVGQVGFEANIFLWTSPLIFWREHQTRFVQLLNSSTEDRSGSLN